MAKAKTNAINEVKAIETENTVIDLKPAVDAVEAILNETENLENVLPEVTEVTGSPVIEENTEENVETPEEEDKEQGEDIAHMSKVEGAYQFQQCKLPPIPYYSKAAFCTIVNDMKRKNDNNKEAFALNIELLETAIAYLTARHNEKLAAEAGE